MSDWIKSLAVPPLTPELLEEIKGRVADGIALGGNYERLFEQYVIAHRDRCALLARVLELEGP